MIFGAHWWDALTAIGTVGAVVVSLGLAWRESKRAKRAETSLTQERGQRHEQERRDIAGLVSSWAESTYSPAPDGTHYVRTVSAFISNGSSEPVFDIYPNVATGSPLAELGPLSIQAQIPVLAARQTRSWDITTGLLAHTTGVGDFPTDPVVSIEFQDSQGQIWRRTYDGTLIQNPGPRLAITDGAANDAENEPPSVSDFNPLRAAAGFLVALAEAASPKDLNPVISPTAPAWKSVTKEDLGALKQQIADYTLAAYVWYPTPRIAYIRLIHNEDVQAFESGSGPARLIAMTLVFLAGNGWRVHSVGGAVTEPDWIKFPRGDLNHDVRG